MNYIMKCIQKVLKQSADAIEVNKDAEAKYTNMIHQEMKKTVWQSGGCNSWYKSKSGHVVAMFPGFSFNYYRLTNRLKSRDHIIY